MSQFLSPLFEWAALFFASLAEAGVTDVVVSPGSRSTPFVLAASRHGRLRVHDVIDERSAAFFALGLVRAQGRPAALLCTSGTAGAHHFAAVVEASAAYLPLVVLTADRPAEAQACGAAQTVDQVKLFGDHVRLFLDPGLVDGTQEGLRAVRRMAAQAVHAALHPTPGPVHVNLRAKKPLEPVPARGADEEQFARWARELAGRPLPRPAVAPAAPDADAVVQAAQTLAGARRGLIVAGPAPLSGARHRAQVAALARATGFPLLPDASSQLRVASTGALAATDVLLGSRHLVELAPDCLIQIGAAPVSDTWERLASCGSVRLHLVVAAHGWQDPASSATHLFAADVAQTCSVLAARCEAQGEAVERRAWAERIAALDGAARARIGALLDASADETSEPSAAMECVAALPPGSLLVVGNSLPIRAVEAWCGHLPEGVGLIAQRGANGIDGLVSTAAGAAAGGSPTLLLVGDVSFVHDLAGLALAARQRSPLAIVVLDNGGGRIFEQLPIAHAGLSEKEWARFTSPPAVSFEAAASAFGVPYKRVASRAALRAAVRAALSHAGAWLIHVNVPPRRAVEQRLALQRGFDEEAELSC